MSAQSDPQQSDLPSSPTSSAPVPKAVLYANRKSPWSSAVLLALYEKGYGDDEFDSREVDVTKGENLDPSYLRINSTSGVPTLVVPLDRYIGPEIESRYRAVVDPKAILEFLDKSRTVISRTHTTSSAPAPALAPATVDHLSASNNLITLIHSSDLDPTFFTLSAVDQTELAEKAKGPAGLYLKQRQDAILRHLAGHEEAPIPTRYKALLDSENLANGALLKIYESASGEPSAELAPLVTEFFEKSKKKWHEELKAVLETFEKTIKEAQASSSGDDVDPKAPAATRGPVAEGESEPAGTYLLGDQLSLVDLHFFVWFARIVSLCGGDLSPDGIYKVEEKANKGANDGWKVGTNIKLFWKSMLGRDSVKKVYAEGIH